MSASPEQQALQRCAAVLEEVYGKLMRAGWYADGLCDRVKEARDSARIFQVTAKPTTDKSP